MSGFGDLARLDATVRPLSDVRPAPGGRWSQFRAATSKTATLLARELDYLGAHRIVIELDLRERDIRLDGMPRSDARVGDPTVVVSFESKYGPLRYATCEYVDWTDNLRAIALAMQALRAVDRYGVSKRGEQYQGWRAIPMSTDPTSELRTAADARAYLQERYDGDLRRGLFESHPDHGGNTDDFRKVIRCKELLAKPVTA